MKFAIFILLCFTPCLLFAQIADSTQRKVPLQGALNFRDIGGYATRDGKHVKWGMIYRSAEISKLTPADLDTLVSRRINYIMDFRGPYEVKAAPDKLPATAQDISLPAGSENIGKDNGAMMKTMANATSGDSIMLPFYVNIEPFKARYKPVFDILLGNSPDSAVMYHCSAGKDRTGICTALVLSALGVDEKTIMDDYLASNYYRQADMERMEKMLVNNFHITPAAVKDVMGVKTSYLNATFTAINTQYGSMDNFLKEVLGLDKDKIEALKKKFTE